MDSLTIVTVAFNNTDLLAKNIDFIKRNSGGIKIKFIVVNNNKEPLYLNTTESGIELLDNKSESFVGDGAESYHHASALNFAINRFINSHYLLIMDPDFFIIYPSWGKDILSHMEKSNLSFIGAPWHPRYYSKYRYFPSVQCLFIDLTKVEKSSLDFTPDINLVPIRKRLALKFIKYKRIYNRLIIGTSRDTGYRIFRRYAHDRKIKSECFNPGIEKYDFSVVDRFLPDLVRYFPSKKNYVIHKDFLNDYYITNGSLRNCEQFYWNQQPWGFHLRRFGNALDGNKQVDLSVIQSVLDRGFGNQLLFNKK
ncbi:MAG: hypothetical protein JXB48_15855 [Candidatus Latescibacteria bacterium]|nr:hypothetical protein [Candidatus Latescibacterota bacterium]